MSMVFTIYIIYLYAIPTLSYVDSVWTGYSSNQTVAKATIMHAYRRHIMGALGLQPLRDWHDGSQSIVVLI